MLREEVVLLEQVKELYPVADPELVVDVRDMGLDRALGEAELRRYLFRRLPGYDVLDDLLLPVGYPVPRPELP